MKKIGRYEVLEEVGRGAMGVVYKASDPTIGRLVAIKAMGISKDDGTPDAWQTFMREARAAGRLSHPGIVTIHDALEDSESGSGYIVMEFIPGRTLESALLPGPSLTSEQSLSIVRQIAEALDYAHKQQVIHRDLKPSNILLTEDGRAKIMDFGIAKILARERTLRTLTVMGTPSYMSPEQVTGGDVDARSDLFSLGIIFYLLLTGQKPFVGDTAAVMFKIAYEDPVSPSQVNSEVAPDLDYLVLRCLAKDRNKRYANAREFLDDLEDVQNGRPPRSQAKFPAEELRTAEPTVAIRKQMSQPAESTLRPPKKSASVIVGVSAAVALVMASAGIVFWRTQHRSTTAPAGVAVKTGGTPAQGSTAGSGPSVPHLSPAPTTPAPPQQPAPTSNQPETKPASNSDGKAAPPGAKPMAVNSLETSKLASSATSPPLPHRLSAAPASTRGGATAGSAVQLVCHHQLRQGTLTVSSGAQTISQWPLRGTKKGGFLGIKGGYAGTLSRSIKIPAGTRELSVHVVSPDGSVDLSQTISATPPRDASRTLQVVVSADQVTLSWRPGSRPTASP